MPAFPQPAGMVLTSCSGTFCAGPRIGTPTYPPAFRSAHLRQCVSRYDIPRRPSHGGHGRVILVTESILITPLSIWHTVYFYLFRDDEVLQAPVGADSS